MTLEKPTIVLFDMDGTTVRHINPRFLNILEHIDDFFFKITKWIHRNDPYRDKIEESTNTPTLLVHRALHKLRTKPVEQIVQPCPGIFTLLNLLYESGIPMGIVSNGLGKGYGYDILEKFDLNKYFSAHIFREDIQRSKPDPDPIIRALKEIKTLTNRDVVWHIGDRRKDIVAALAANNILPAKVVPFSYGVKAAVTILEKGLSPEQIIVNYNDFATRIYPLVKE